MKNAPQKIGQRFSFMNRFLTGMVIALALTLTAFEWTTVTTEEKFSWKPEPIEDPTDFPPPTIFKVKKLEPPKIEKPSDVIKIIKNEPDPIDEEPPKIEPIDEEPFVLDIDPDAYGMNDDDVRDIDLPYTVVQVFAHYDKCQGLTNDELMECSKVDIQNRIKQNFKVTGPLRDIGGRQAALMVIVVDENGEVVSIEAERSSSKHMTRAATKAIEKLPKMHPAQQQGRKVKLSFKIPVILSFSD